MIALLPILEHPYTLTVLDELQRHGINSSSLIQLAINEGSDYWRGLAIQWLISGHPIDSKTAAILESFGHGKVGKQKDRHEAYRLAVRWKKADEEQGFAKNEN